MLKVVCLWLDPGDDDEEEEDWEAGDDFDDGVDDCLGDYDLEDL